MGSVSIPSGGASGTISITSNGIHDVKKYAKANVNIGFQVAQVGTITKNNGSFSVSSYPGYKNFSVYNFSLGGGGSLGAWNDAQLSSGTTGTRSLSFSYNSSTGVFSWTYGSYTNHNAPSIQSMPVYLVYLA